MSIFQKINDAAGQFFEFIKGEPIYTFAFVCALEGFYIVGLILDWDWTIARSRETQNPFMVWLQEQPRKTQRIVMGCMSVALVISFGVLLFWGRF